MGQTSSVCVRSFYASRRLAILTLALLSALAVPTGQARADLIYTWHEDDGQYAWGKLIVNESARYGGMITDSSIMYFLFLTPNGGIGKSMGTFSGPIEIPISKVDGGFTGAPGTGITQYGDIGIGSVTMDENWSTPGGESWLGYFITTPDPLSGRGHWTIQHVASAAPEPSSIALMLLGVVGAGGWKLLSRRRTAAGSLS